jgi:hypothetical protein
MRGEQLAVWIILTTACTAAVLFYLRFLVALCKECGYVRISYLLRIESDVDQQPMIDTAREVPVFKRAA